VEPRTGKPDQRTRSGNNSPAGNTLPAFWPRTLTENSVVVKRTCPQPLIRRFPAGSKIS
jgi:hypothetical protein